MLKILVSIVICSLVLVGVFPAGVYARPATRVTVHCAASWLTGHGDAVLRGNVTLEREQPYVFTELRRPAGTDYDMSVIIRHNLNRAVTGVRAEHVIERFQGQGRMNITPVVVPFPDGTWRLRFIYPRPGNENSTLRVWLDLAGGGVVEIHGNIPVNGITFTERTDLPPPQFLAARARVGTLTWAGPAAPAPAPAIVIQPAAPRIVAPPATARRIATPPVAPAPRIVAPPAAPAPRIATPPVAPAPRIVAPPAAPRPAPRRVAVTTPAPRPVPAPAPQQTIRQMERLTSIPAPVPVRGTTQQPVVIQIPVLFPLTIVLNASVIELPVSSNIARVLSELVPNVLSMPGRVPDAHILRPASATIAQILATQAPAPPVRPMPTPPATPAPTVRFAPRPAVTVPAPALAPRPAATTVRRVPAPAVRSAPAPAPRRGR